MCKIDEYLALSARLERAEDLIGSLLRNSEDNLAATFGSDEIRILIERISEDVEQLFLRST